MSQSVQRGHEPCPKCRSVGHDRRGDNLKHFTDGSKHCFSCSYHINARGVFKRQVDPVTSNIEFNIPLDADTTLSDKAVNWLRDYHLSLSDIIKNRILWSEQMQWLIFPIEYRHAIVGFQARNFNPNKPYKWYTKFKKHNVFLELGHVQHIVLVEDIVSAIRVSHHATALPLFGSHVNDDLVKYLVDRKLPVTIWLDRDKASNAIGYAKRLRSVGIPTHTLITKLDPKEYESEQIRCYLQK